MPPLRRHQLAFVTADGWKNVLARTWGEPIKAGLTHWAAQGLPVVVTRQLPARANTAGRIALGVCLPETWERQRVALQLMPKQLSMFTEFPPLTASLGALSALERKAMRHLAASLAANHLQARVYGSVGWQTVTGLPYLHDHSDIDLWLAVKDAHAADTAVHFLQQVEGLKRRVDGELVFPDGAAVAWREWAAWRQGRCQRLLVKHLLGQELRDAMVCDKRQLQWEMAT
ncbi:MAG: malonate decarboxylase holo-[acyl-carrier-protein] synthase [Hydrogenophaga sp.]|uniref:malonate decarboxylase holo-[acyl-carrier-protein] synthase n=1 Tax=Hydrogenophaga sp. TaxID=1904254 RepID=UPI0027291366|nr:malonate decarboxylase holo-[acyl-carrier-protein] synthase [Hydrogenophaga sp.]MDO9479716.1 malonate decarboxylase holo-[acyl-carrier-protein] synthase [Hydrogenophaga sp.]MDP1893817.1 malonate decarboxylase holo-[acyl-carrier-protein] synthase [Hydrogenophaga sp.]MDP3344078.1 malonate decarboxylase holo-[acyl-carrier-protein] synthase [Hydrogenophaga sp.]MDP3806004.1 malonate decarboxylase holo-[acyl-carrier-protein] synthase [Hydrogenophaga sp.]